MKKKIKIPTALTIIKWIASGSGKLRGHEAYMTKTQIIYLCRKYLKAKGYTNA